MGRQRREGKMILRGESACGSRIPSASGYVSGHYNMTHFDRVDREDD